MAPEKIYNPADICKIFDITKSTLLRWEEHGKFPGGDFPLPKRDSSGERLYTQIHLRAIAEHKKRQLKNLYERIAEDDLDQAKEVQRHLSLLKARYFGDPTGLLELVAAGEMPYNQILHFLADYVELNEIEPEENSIWDLTFQLVSKLVTPK